jgi:hypothetical protein
MGFSSDVLRSGRHAVYQASAVLLTAGFVLGCAVSLALIEVLR